MDISEADTKFFITCFVWELQQMVKDDIGINRYVIICKYIRIIAATYSDYVNICIDRSRQTPYKVDVERKLTTCDKKDNSSKDLMLQYQVPLNNGILHISRQYTAVFGLKLPKIQLEIIINLTNCNGVTF